MVNLNFSRRNRVDYATNSDKAKQLIEEFVEEFDQARKRRLTDEQRSECFRNFEVLILDLLAAWSEDERRYIGYSRGKANYVRGGSYWDYQNDRSLLSEAYYLGAIDFLVERGFIENHVVQAGGQGQSSRMKATSELGDRFVKRDLSWASILMEPEAPVIIVKDENKEIIPLPDPGKFDLEVAIRNIKRINENLQNSYLNLDISDEDHEKIKMQFSSFDEAEGLEIEGAEFRDPIDFSNRSLKRVFSLGNFSNGGRFYGGWWQTVPSGYRKHIEIDGMVTRECDFSEMQPRMLYALSNQEVPEDSYLLDGWDKDLRPIIKSTFYKLINGSKSSRNPRQWHRFTPSIDLAEVPENWFDLNSHHKNKLRREEFVRRTGRDFNELIGDLLNKHSKIEEHFFSKAWGAIQNFDSQIAERVMIKLLDHEPPVTALPIHDSFIVRRGAEELLEFTMEESFAELMIHDGVVRRDEAVYDPPEGHEVKGIVRASDIWEEVAEHFRTHSRYHIRERQWQEVWGLSSFE